VSQQLRTSVNTSLVKVTSEDEVGPF